MFGAAFPGRRQSLRTERRRHGHVLDGLTEAISGDASVAAVSFDAHTTLVGVTEVDVVTGTHTFKVDEPEVLGGTDLAANPVQLVLASLGACQAITYQVWAPSSASPSRGSKPGSRAASTFAASSASMTGSGQGSRAS